MAFLNSKQLAEEQQSRGMIDPWDKNQIEQGKYELSVAEEYFHTAMDDGKQTLSKGEQIVIPPGQLALLLTHETIYMPNDRMGFISIKFGNKVRGLINVSGFHVDPGFKGKLKFSVYNAGSSNAIIDPLKPLFQIWFSTLTSPEDEKSAYDGTHNNQKSITANDVNQIQGTIASPGTLLEEIKSIKLELRYYRALGAIAAAVLLAALIIPPIKLAVAQWIDKQTSIEETTAAPLSEERTTSEPKTKPDSSPPLSE